MAKSFWVMRNISAVGFNAHSGSYVLGVPQLTAIAGWLHGWMLQLSRTTGRAFDSNPEFIYAIENYGGLSGISLNTRTEKGAAGGKRGIPAPIIDKPKSHATISIIIGWDGTEGSLLAPGISGGKIKEAIEKSRLMGASLFMDRQEECVFLEESWEAATRRLGAMAFILSDASDQLAQRLRDSESSSTISAICDMISRPKDGSYKPRYVPIVSGYQALDKPGVDIEAKSRSGGEQKVLPIGFRMEEIVDPSKIERHEQYEHAWAEPIMSVGLFQAKAAAVKALRMGSFKGCWLTTVEEGLWRVAGVKNQGASDVSEEDFFI